MRLYFKPGRNKYRLYDITTIESTSKDHNGKRCQIFLHASLWQILTLHHHVGNQKLPLIPLQGVKDTFMNERWENVFFSIIFLLELTTSTMGSCPNTLPLVSKPDGGRSASISTYWEIFVLFFWIQFVPIPITIFTSLPERGLFSSENRVLDR